MIDTGYSDTLFLLINSIYKLGFSPYDVKYIIHTHWHGDHTEATQSLVHLTGANTLAKGHFDYEGCIEDYRNSLNRLRNKKVDVFIGNHVWNNDTEAKAENLKTTGENKFIDGNIWYEFLDFCEKRLDELIEKENIL